MLTTLEGAETTTHIGSLDATAGVITKAVRPGRYYVRISDGNGFRYELRVDVGHVLLEATVPEG